MIFNKRKPSKKKRLTWYFNEKVVPRFMVDVNFTSGDAKWTRISYSSAFGLYEMYYIRLVNSQIVEKVTVYDDIRKADGWKGTEAYRTITFDEEPTGNLLTWLEANATPQ